MTLLEAVKGLETLDELNVIYAVEPFTEGSELQLVFQSDAELPSHAPPTVRLAYKYFLKYSWREKCRKIGGQIFITSRPTKKNVTD